MAKKMILVIDVDDIDIENTQVTYIELKCNNQTRQMSLVNHWLKPLPERFEPTILTDYCLGNADGWNACVDEILGEE